MSSFLGNVTKQIAKTSAGSKFLANMFSLFAPNGEISKSADKSLVTFADLIQKKNLDVKKLKAHVIADCLRYGVGANEYFLFRFYEIPDEKKGEFLGAYGGINIWKQCANQYENNDDNVFRNKYLCAKKFEAFFKRGVCMVTSAEDRQTFLDFVAQCPIMMTKPFNESEGRNVKKFTASVGTEEALFQQVLENAPCIVEEFIKQGEPLAALHPSSVNTVRYMTIVTNGKVHRIYAILRMGCGGSHIDNLAAGGMCAAIDLETGKLTTDAFREDCTSYETHPDSGIKIKGYQLPDWESCNRLIEQAALQVPEHRLIGWDFAYAEKYGWIMVEANHRPSFTGYQFCTGTGIKKRVEQALQD